MLSSLEDIVVDDRRFNSWLAYLLLFAASMILETLFHEAIRDSMLGRLASNVLGKFAGLPASPVLLAVVIFANNLLVATILAITSPTLIIPVAIIIFNGVLVGYVVSERVGVLGQASLLVGLTTHGGIEVSAISLAAALGLIAGGGFLRTLKLSVKLAPVIIVMLSLAAITEAFITPILMAFFKGLSIH